MRTPERLVEQVVRRTGAKINIEQAPSTAAGDEPAVAAASTAAAAATVAAAAYGGAAAAAAAATSADLEDIEYATVMAFAQMSSEALLTVKSRGAFMGRAVQVAGFKPPVESAHGISA